MRYGVYMFGDEGMIPVDVVDTIEEAADIINDDEYHNDFKVWDYRLDDWVSGTKLLLAVMLAPDRKVSCKVHWKTEGF